MHPVVHRLLPGLSALAALAVPPAEAQIRASERGSVSQTVDGTVVTVDYARPRMRNRERVFGGTVRWGEVWTPGANQSTTLETNRDIQLNGHPVPKGKYSVWLVVREAGDWTAVLDTNARRYHTEPPDTTKAFVKFPVRKERRPAAEVLTWTFTGVSSAGMTLALQWDTVYVPLDIAVTPSHPTTLDPGLAGRYIGKYLLAPTSPGSFIANGSIEVFYEKGSLRGKWFPILGGDPDYEFSILMRLKDDMFLPGFLHQGELFDVADEVAIEFVVENGRASRVDIRAEDKVIASGKRAP